MKLHERINCILLGTLWTLAIVLVLDFWLNTAYNFNIFSNAHWQYVADMQASNQPIATGFYVSVVLAVFACIFGLYVLLRPRFRKIIFTAPNAPIPPTQPTVPEQKTIEKPEPTKIITNQPQMQRPPRLHIQTHNITPPKTATPNKTEKPAKKTPIEPRYVHEIREIFERNGYRVLTPKTLSGTPLSLIALGTNETLWLGACDISHEQMVDVILSFKAVFQETLEDIEIDINGFIINPTDNDTIEAILDFKSIDELSNTVDNNPNAPESDADKESGNMNAFAGYIDTVLTYLGNK